MHLELLRSKRGDSRLPEMLSGNKHIKDLDMKFRTSFCILFATYLGIAAPVVAITNENFASAVEEHLTSMRKDEAINLSTKRLCINLRGQRFDDDVRCVAYDRLKIERLERERESNFALYLVGAVAILIALIPAVITLRRGAPTVGAADVKSKLE